MDFNTLFFILFQDDSFCHYCLTYPLHQNKEASDVSLSFAILPLNLLIHLVFFVFDWYYITVVYSENISIKTRPMF